MRDRRKHEEARGGDARGEDRGASAKPSIRPRETDGGEFEDYALERKAAENEVATEAPRETVEVDYGIFEHVTISAERFPGGEASRRASSRRREGTRPRDEEEDENEDDDEDEAGGRRGGGG